MRHWPIWLQMCFFVGAAFLYALPASSLINFAYGTGGNAIGTIVGITLAFPCGIAFVAGLVRLAERLGF